MPENKKAEKNNGSRIEVQARNAAEPILKEAGYRLWDVVFEKEGAMWYLRVLFDKGSGEDSITDEECEKITVPLNAAFDKHKFIESVDILEIGSPGLTRRLRLPEHFKDCLNLAVRCTVRGQNGKTEVILGTLAEYSEENGTICVKTEENGKSIKNVIEIKKCIRINLDLIT